MNTLINTEDFGMILRTINCFSTNDFKIIFGGSHEHFRTKLYVTYKGDISKWLMYLDKGNIRATLSHALNKMKEYEDAQ